MNRAIPILKNRLLETTQKRCGGGLKITRRRASAF
jgi:hypothetical protein